MKRTTYELPYEITMMTSTTHQEAEEVGAKLQARAAKRSPQN